MILLRIGLTGIVGLLVGTSGCALGELRDLVTLGGGAELVLVEDGVAQAEIVIEAGALETTRLAGRELQKYVKEATGATLPIVKKPRAGRKHIFISSTDGLKPNGFAIQAHDGHLFIRGHDSAGRGDRVDYYKPVLRGTCNGVYEFLERFVGVRWFWQEPLGIIVPNASRLAVPAKLIIKQEPRFEYRSVTNGPAGSRKGDWARWHRLGAAHGMSHGHALQRILPVDVWARRGHPEYAAMRGNKRRTRKPGSSGGHICMSNPEVINIVAEAAIDDYRRNPELDMFSISPPDGSGMCLCDVCMSWDEPDYRVPIGLQKGKEPVKSRRALRFYNAVAERLTAEYPDKLVGAYIYMDYLFPPRMPIDVHPNVALVVVPNFCCENWKRENWAFTRELFPAWAKLHDRVYAYDTCYRIRRSYGLPTPMGDRLVASMRLYDSSGMRGCYLYLPQGWEQMGHESYLIAKMLWDPKTNVKKTMDEYYGLLYQSAAPSVRRFYALAGDAWRDAWVASDADVQRAASRFQRAKHSGPDMMARIMIGYESRISRMRQAVADAERAARGDATLQNRVARVRDCLTLTETTVGVLQAVTAYEKGGGRDTTLLQPVDELIRRREEVLKQMERGYGANLVEALRWADDRDSTPMRMDSHYYKLAMQAGDQ